MDSAGRVAPQTPSQPWPPALIFECPDSNRCGWFWHAADARGYEARLQRAFEQHCREQHGKGPQQLTFEATA